MPDETPKSHLYVSDGHTCTVCGYTWQSIEKVKVWVTEPAAGQQATSTVGVGSTANYYATCKWFYEGHEFTGTFEEGKTYTVKEVRPRYSCFYKIWHPGDCDGQSGYGVSKLDSIVEEVVRKIFAQFREVSRKKLLESVKNNDAARIQKKIKKIQKDLESKQKELDDLKAETILVIRGASALDKELLGTLVAEAREALETLEKQLVQAQEEYEEATKTAKRSNYMYL